MGLLGKTLKGRAPTSEEVGQIEKPNEQNVREKIVTLTLEEQQRRLNEEQKKLDHLKNATRAELQLLELNAQKARQNWRKILDDVKTEELRRELELESAAFWLRLENQDAFIREVDARLTECGEQQQAALRAAYVHSERLNSLDAEKLGKLEMEFGRALRGLSEEFQAEREQIEKGFKAKKQAVLDLMQQIEREEAGKETAAKEHFQQAREEIKDKTTEEIEVMQTEMNSRKVCIYNALENLFQKFMNDSKEKFRKYTNLLEANAADSRAIDEAMRRIARTRDKIRQVSLRTQQLTAECDARDNLTKAENEEIARNFLALKHRMFKFRGEQNKKLTRLSTNARDAVEKLEEACDLGRTILKNAELCRRLEFENEKVQPFSGPVENRFNSRIENTNNIINNINNGDNDNTDGLFEMVTAGGGDEEDRETSQALAEYCQRFELFRNYFGKFNRVFVDKLAAEHEKNTLMAENRELKSKLTAFLEGVTVDEFSLEKDDNTLMRTKPMGTNDLDETADTIGRCTVVEGNLEVRKMVMHSK